MRERSKDITIKVLQGKSCANVAQEYCISTERTRQIFWRTVRHANIHTFPIPTIEEIRAEGKLLKHLQKQSGD